MTLSAIANSRLTSQQLAATGFTTVSEIVGWMGAIQAQDYAMAKWAIGVRLPGSTETTIQTAIDKGEIIRTHVLRPTWHFVLAEDVYWMLELTAAQIKASMKSRNKQLELTEAIFKKSHDLIEKELRDNNHLTREALLIKLQAAKINIADQRATHLLFQAELDGIIGSGVSNNSNHTYALLTERVSKAIRLNKDEALGKLAKTYFLSHGAATVQDFAWWSGLSGTDAKHGFEMVRSSFVSETINGQTYWISNSLHINTNTQPIYLLPAFDEFLISYTDRTCSIILELQNKTFTKNGIFNPVIVEKGKVSGTWKRIIKKDKVIIETDLFKPQSETAKKRIITAARSFGIFLNKKIELHENIPASYTA